MSADRHPTSRRGGRLPVRATGYGLHRTDHLGVPASGRPYAVPSMHLYRGEADRLAEHWGVRDELSVLYQVGALTPGPLPSFAVD
jgi:predicted ester cyclase